MRGYRSGAAQRTKTRACRSRRLRYARAQKIPIRRARRHSSDPGRRGGAQFKVPAATSAVITNGASAARVRQAAPQTASADATADPALYLRRWRGHQPCPVRRCAAAPQRGVATLRSAAADAWGAASRVGRRQRVPEAWLGAAVDSARPRGRQQSMSKHALQPHGQPVQCAAHGVYARTLHNMRARPAAWRRHCASAVSVNQQAWHLCQHPAPQRPP
jgi:hypothetical protein